MFPGSEELSARIGRCRSGDALLDGIVGISSSRQRGVGAQSAQGGVATEGNQANRAQAHPRRSVARAGRFRALFRSQHGPLVSAPFTARPTSRARRMDAPTFPHPSVQKVASSPSSDSAYLPMWPPTRHVWPSSCSVRRGGGLGAPWVSSGGGRCSDLQGGWRSRVHKRLRERDLDLAAFNVLDGRRLEVVADGLTLFRGAQLAIDTTMGLSFAP